LLVSGRTIRVAEASSLPESIKAPDTVEVLGIPVNRFDRSSLTQLLGHMPSGRKKGWLSYVNVHAVNLAQELPWFKEFLKDSLVTYCDGEGVRLGSRIIGNPLPERIAMTDWIYDVCAVAERQEWRLYLLGSTDTVLEKTTVALRKKYAGLHIAGCHNGYFAPEDNKNIVSAINRTRPHVLIVGMGMPKQERWILDNIDSLDVPLVMNAGACFDYVAGEKRRCPGWMGRWGFEWLFRFAVEPRRLWRRYLIGNTLYLTRIVKQRFTNLTPHNRQSEYGLAGLLAHNNTPSLPSGL